MSPRPVVWKPKYGTRRLREQAFARADLARERSVSAAAGRRRSLFSRALGLFR